MLASDARVLSTRGTSLCVCVCFLLSSKLCSRLRPVVLPAHHAHVLTNTVILFCCLVSLFNRDALYRWPTIVSLLSFSVLSTVSVCMRRAVLLFFARFLGTTPPWSCPVSTHPRGIPRQRRRHFSSSTCVTMHNFQGSELSWVSSKSLTRLY